MIKYGPDKTAEFSGHGGDGHVRVFPLPEFVELPGKAVLCLYSDGDNLRRLSLTTAIEDQIGPRPMPVIPGGFYEYSSGL